MKIIVTTTINSPTEAILKFSSLEDWKLIVIGDKKTPHDEYKKINCIYLEPDEQEKKYKNLSNLIGWNSIQRRNIGFLEAYKMGAEIVATVDDDNYPYDDWGKNILVNKTMEVDVYETQTKVSDPLCVTNNKDLWHRGFPIELIKEKNNFQYIGKQKKEVLIQADLWDGDPDIDAICRMTKKPMVKFEIKHPFSFTKISPFNSQNTFISRKIIPYYAVLPFIGRMDDIWASYIIQERFKNNLIYSSASVYQNRNQHDLIKDMENEIIGYRNTLKFIDKKFELPEKTKEFYKNYMESF